MKFSSIAIIALAGLATNAFVYAESDILDTHHNERKLKASKLSPKVPKAPKGCKSYPCRRSLYDERELLTLLDENERGEALQAYTESEVLELPHNERKLKASKLSPKVPKSQKKCKSYPCRRSLYDERELLTLLDENERGEALQAYTESEVLELPHNERKLKASKLSPKAPKAPKDCKSYPCRRSLYNERKLKASKLSPKVPKAPKDCKSYPCRRSLYDERELLTLLDENERGEALQASTESEVLMGDESYSHLKDKSQTKQDGAPTPWASPSSEKAALLASDPGIWTVDNFLTNEESNKLIDMLKKNGHEKGLFGPCSDSELQEEGHPHFESPNRHCFKMSPETLHNELFYKKAQLADPDSVHKGHLAFDSYDCGESGCSVETDPEDGAFLASIMTKVKDLWSTDVNPRPHVSVVLVTGTAMPLQLHDDTDILASFVLYLSNGGAATVFPEAGVTIVPRKGTLAMWLNMDENGDMNPMAQHAVQAHPARAGERMTVNIFIRDVTPEEFLISQDRRRLV